MDRQVRTFTGNSKWLASVIVALTAGVALAEDPSKPAELPNIIFILTDDQRWDAVGFMDHPFLETPNMDRLHDEGVTFANAFVTTSLCSPSRASILTGQYAHNHRVVDNYNPVDPSLRFFPEYLQEVGYETACIGKWHMGDVDDPQRGFDHWVSFRGQGTYWPDGHGTTRVVPQTHYGGYNINGKRVPQKGYITDELTDYTIDWIKGRKSDKPYFVYLSHKAVHSDFVAADRHKGRYAKTKMKLPVTYANTPENYDDKPMWLKNQRNSRHGVDYAYNLKDFDLNAYYQRYCETLLAVDDSLGRILDFLEKRGELDSTLVVYMGDNGFQFGEHGLIDKRAAYEASMRVPLLARWPKGLPKGTEVDEIVANIDIGPTLLAVAGVETPKQMDGTSFLPLAQSKEIPWRDALLYEYFWEWNYPHTPTLHALRTDRYKYIRYHGLWDTNELYDLKADPHETTNLINDPKHRKLAEQFNDQLFAMLRETSGDQLPLLRDRGKWYPWRLRDRAKQGLFPNEFFNPPPDLNK
ncbi:Arylsulfatase [Planctomycetes bacterium Pan216]|uniref:Arylsulfatase n=1 Tax=Kolteria novifilia TaxID=2527975 RepID=A0A518B7M5_9BACT|nr:Arylsulfatase [Planctomycetes bacterium Pan216]